MRRASISLDPYFSLLFGEIPFLSIVPKEHISAETHIILPCYSIPNNPAYSMWVTVFPLFHAVTNVAELTKLYSFTTPTNLQLFQSLTQQETANFFRDTLPIIISLAAIHPRLFPTPVAFPTDSRPTLQLNRVQAASLFALAFLGLIRVPVGFQDATQFSRCLSLGDTVSATKLRCFMSYFGTIGYSVIQNDSLIKESITFERVSAVGPHWEEITDRADAKVSVVSNIIESDAAPVLKSVFSSKLIGGNILDNGCSQEEIIFIKCPECMCALLVAPILFNNESFRIYNVLQCSEVSGYTREIAFAGNIASQRMFVGYSGLW